MVSTTITFEKDAVQPPVFVAGGFTDWEPIEMRCKATETNGSAKNVFSHKTDLEPGEYQYKFRLGPGDWWVLDESSSTAPDENGNLNNVLSVKPQHPNPVTELPVEAILTPTAHDLNTKEAPIVEDEPKLNGSVEQAEFARPEPHSGEVVPDLHDSGAPAGSQTALEPQRSAPEKQVQFDEQTGRITAETVQLRKNSIPDIAPPPYSAAVDVSISGTPEEAPTQKQPAAPAPAGAKTQSEKKQHSFIAQILSGRGLVLVFAAIGIPIAASYYLRR